MDSSSVAKAGGPTTDDAGLGTILPITDNMLASTTLRCIRVAYCLYTTYPSMGKDLVKKFIKYLAQNAQGAGFGSVGIILEWIYVVMDCLFSTAQLIGTGGASFLSFIKDCVGVPSWAGIKGAFTMFKQFFAESFEFILRFVNLPWFAGYSRALFEHTGTLINAIWNKDIESAREFDLQAIFATFKDRDWTYTAFVFILAKFPFHAFVNGLISLIKFTGGATNPKTTLVLGWLQLVQHYALPPIYLVQWLVEIGAYIYYGKEYLEELFVWVTQMVPCIIKYLRTSIQYYFGYDERSERAVFGPLKELPCCNFEIIKSLEQWVYGESGTQRVVTWMDKALGPVRKVVGYGVDASQAVFGEGSAEFAGIKSVASSLFKLDNTLTAGIAASGAPNNILGALTTVAMEGGGSLQVPANVIGSTSQFSSLVSYVYSAFPCDERLKVKITNVPFVTFFIQGQHVPFYVFTWAQGARLRDEYTLHLSPMAQELETQFPGCTIEHKGVKFVRLCCLPNILSQRMLEAGLPVVDLTQL